MSILIIFFLTFKQNQFRKNNIDINNENFSYDIKNPKFTINGNNEKISIKAQGASFINSNEILLEKNVIFKSNTFTLQSPEVIFNRENKTAYSRKNSIFTSKGTTINSNGFEIFNEGDKINFKGNTKVILIK